MGLLEMVLREVLVQMHLLHFELLLVCLKIRDFLSRFVRVLPRPCLLPLEPVTVPLLFLFLIPLPASYELGLVLRCLGLWLDLVVAVGLLEDDLWVGGVVVSCGGIVLLMVLLLLVCVEVN